MQHSTPVMKLPHYGIRGRTRNLNTSNLADRVPRIDVNGEKSPGSVISMAILQGSILGPFFFNIYNGFIVSS